MSHCLGMIGKEAEQEEKETEEFGEAIFILPMIFLLVFLVVATLAGFGLAGLLFFIPGWRAVGFPFLAGSGLAFFLAYKVFHYLDGYINKL